MSAAMSMRELGELLKHIRQHYSPGTPGAKTWVKYVHPNIDNRDGKCFSVLLRGYGWEMLFHTQNECRDLSESLYQRVVSFLAAKSESTGELYKKDGNV